MTAYRARQTALGFANVALSGLAALSVLALFARQGWVPELASHFRLQYTVLLLLLGAVYVTTRRPIGAVLALAALLPNAVYVAPYLLPSVVSPSIAAPAGQPVSIVSLNLYLRNADYAAVRDYLGDRQADVLVLSELTPAWVTELSAITAEYPYWVAVDRRTPWGLGVYSKYPLKDAQATDLGLDGSVNVTATVALPDGDVQLVGVHLASPTSPDRAKLRNRQIGNLAELLGPPRSAGAGSRPPRLLVGDMNLTPFSPYFSDLLDRTGMIDARRQQEGLSTTWPTWIMPLRIPIDHCIADPDLPVAGVKRGPSVGSDHYPVEITLHQRG